MLKKNLLKYFFLAFLLLVSYYLQIALFKKLQINVFENKIIASYFINTIVVIIFFLFVDLFQKKFKDQIGFAFMASSMLKFALFFIFIYPSYHKDGILTKNEMLTFFIPYTICLIYETLIVSKILNNLKFN